MGNRENAANAVDATNALGKKDIKLNILQVHNCYRFRGGEENVVEAERKMLEKRGHKVFTYIRDNQEIDGATFGKKLMMAFGSVFSIGTYHDICYRIRKDEIDVVHVHNTIHMISPSVFWAAKHCHVPVVMTAHNYRLCCANGCFYHDGDLCEKCLETNSFHAIRYGCYKESLKLSALMGFQIWFHQKLHTYKDVTIIALNDFQKEKLIQIPGICRRQVAVKSNFYTRATQDLNGTMLEESDETRPREKAFFFAGRFSKEKGIMELLKEYDSYCRKCRDVEPYVLYLAGTGPLLDEAKEYCKKHQINGVFFIGRISEWQVVEFMKQVEYVIVPSTWYEGFPMVIAEANEAKTPILASDIGALSGLVKAHRNGFLFDPHKENALANLMKYVTTKPEKYQCDFKDMPDYSEEANYKRLMDIYHKTIMRCEY